MSLHTRVCEILEIDYPIVLAGMGGASGPELAAAVSNAGGLGVLGAAACGPKQLREWIRRTRALTDKPFGVDTLLPASVRRANYEGQNGPTPAEQLPELQTFARDFMTREGLAQVDPAALRQVRDLLRPISYEELSRVLEIWVETALRLQARDLRMMERLIGRQEHSHALAA